MGRAPSSAEPPVAPSNRRRILAISATIRRRMPSRDRHGSPARPCSAGSAPPAHDTSRNSAKLRTAASSASGVWPCSTKLGECQAFGPEPWYRAEVGFVLRTDDDAEADAIRGDLGHDGASAGSRTVNTLPRPGALATVTPGRRD